MKKIKNKLNIDSFGDLKFERQRLQNEITDQEQSLKENPLVKISSSIYGSDAEKGSLRSALYENGVKSGLQYVKPLLLANNVTRKYFLAYSIAKEMVPFALKKVNSLLKKQ